MASFYDFSLISRTGEPFNLADLKGKVVVVVNTATACGFTPQFAPLEQMYKDYHDKGLEIVDIPCNQFGEQAKGTDDEIHQFCSLNFNKTFPQMKKSDVNGANELPLYTFLKSQQGFKGLGEGKMADILRGILPNVDPNYENTPDIKWNFTKFVIDKSGKVVGRFEPTYDMEEFEKYVVSLL